MCYTLYIFIIYIMYYISSYIICVYILYVHVYIYTYSGISQKLRRLSTSLFNYVRSYHWQTTKETLI